MKDILKIACVGDSITFQKYWNNNLQGGLPFERFEVRGFGHNGATALYKGVDGGKPLAFADQQAYADSFAYGADIVVIMLGTNDAKNSNWRVYGEKLTDDYVRLIRAYQTSATHPRVYAALPPSAYGEGEAYDGINDTTLTAFIIPALRKAAELTAVTVIDTHTATAGNPALFYDGVHPTAEGQKILSETIANAILADADDTEKPKGKWRKTV